MSDGVGRSFNIMAGIPSEDAQMWNTRTQHALVGIVLVTSLGSAHAQVSHHFGGVGEDLGRVLAVDTSGTAYLVGRFSDTVDFPRSDGVTTLTSAGEGDAFLARLGAEDTVEWVVQIGGAGMDNVLDADVYSDGSVAVVGTVFGTVDLDPGPGVVTHIGGGGPDIFLARFSPEGMLEWAKGLPGPGIDAPASISLDRDGNAYITGMIHDSTDFDPGPAAYYLSSVSGRDIFVARYDSLGAFVWAYVVGGPADDTGRGIVVNSDTTFCMIADFHYPFDIDPGPDTRILSNDGGLDALIASFGLDGSLIWAAEVVSTGFSQFTDVDADDSGNCYSAGWFSGQGDFTAGGGEAILTSVGDWDAVTTAHSPGGSLLWARQIGSTGQDRANRLSVNRWGQVFSAGSFSGAANIDPGPATQIIMSNGGTDAFVSALDGSGNLIGAQTFGGSSDDFASHVVQTKGRRLIAVGGFAGEIEIGEETFVSEGDLDILVLELDIPGSRTIFVDVSAFLEGPYVAGAMWPGVLHLASIPLSQPYDATEYLGTPLQHDGEESVAAVSDSVIDWVIVGLRDSPPAEDIAKRAALLFRSGAIRDLDGHSPVRFDEVDRRGYYAVVRHRNHVAVMSSDTLSTSDGFGSWDFTGSASSAYSTGSAPMKSLGNGHFGLYGCDINADGLVTAPDFNMWNAETTAGAIGYVRSDCNLDGQSSAPDFNVWNANTTAGARSHVPD